MAYKISDSCVACGTCIDECPVEAISAGDIYVIDPDKCIECGACAGVCPSEAISLQSHLPKGQNRDLLTYVEEVAFVLRCWVSLSLLLSFVGQSIEISNPFIRDYERVIAFAAYINKSPSQEGDLGGG